MNLISYETNETIRTATIDEAIESINAARFDGGVSAYDRAQLLEAIGGTLMLAAFIVGAMLLP
jgi:hypothetical protein